MKSDIGTEQNDIHVDMRNAQCEAGTVSYAGA